MHDVLVLGASGMRAGLQDLKTRRSVVCDSTLAPILGSKSGGVARSQLLSAPLGTVVHRENLLQSCGSPVAAIRLHPGCTLAAHSTQCYTLR